MRADKFADFNIKVVEFGVQSQVLFDLIAKVTLNVLHRFVAVDVNPTVFQQNSTDVLVFELNSALGAPLR